MSLRARRFSALIIFFLICMKLCLVIYSSFYQSRLLEDILTAERKPVPGKSIFFLETSCHEFGWFNCRSLHLTARQACTIEAAALNNPNSTVFVLFVGPRFDTNRVKNRAVLDAILKYKNVEIRSVDFWSYVAGTPIEEWLKTGAFFETRHLTSHLSDLLRFLTLYRYGGLYLDLDSLLLRNIDDLSVNYAGIQVYILASGVVNLSHDGVGHDIAELCLQYFQNNFNPRRWQANGPVVIHSVIERVCGTTNVTIMQKDPKRCKGFQILPRATFYPIFYGIYEYPFDPKYLNFVMKELKNAYCLHLWNKLSIQLPVKEGSAYMALAQANCPRIWRVGHNNF